MAEIQVPPMVRLLCEVAVLRLTVKTLDRENPELGGRLARLNRSM
jgi:hypothetical protein